MMKAYVITLFEYPESIEVANRCIESGKKFGIDIQHFKAIHKSISLVEMENNGLRLAEFNQAYSNLDAVVGNFMSQYYIWCMIRDSETPGIIFEHDAVVVSPIPELSGDIINLGKPSFGSYNTKNGAGIYPLFSKNPVHEFGRYMPGAHAYYITPYGADQLINVAHARGILPCDVFINTKNFPEIREVFPWPVEAHDSFTTIQKNAGCKAKHNFNDDYKIIN